MKHDPTQPSKGQPDGPASNDRRRLWHPLLLNVGKTRPDPALDVLIKLANLRRS
jgi:hypothetical protein